MSEGNSKIPHSKKYVEEFLILWKTLNDNEKKTLLFNMLEGNLVSKLHHLAIQGVDLVHCEEDGTNLLHHAAYSDNPEVIQCLLYIGCELEKKDINGRTPLHIASTNGNLHTLKILLENSKSWLVKDNFGKNFLQLANENLVFKIYLLTITLFIKKKIFRF
jgi:ankyrin repeat protein